MSQPRPVRETTSSVKPIRALYRAINERDYEAGFALLDERFEWREPAHGLLGGLHRGADEVRIAIEMQLDVFDEFTIEPEAYYERGETVAVSVRQRARGGASGVEVEIRIGHLWIVRNGKAISLEVFPARADARRAAEAATGPNARRPDG
jgi:ketosteroid isomerase-like protein